MPLMSCWRSCFSLLEKRPVDRRESKGTPGVRERLHLTYCLDHAGAFLPLRRPWTTESSSRGNVRTANVAGSGVGVADPGAATDSMGPCEVYDGVGAPSVRSTKTSKKLLIR